MSIVSMSVFLRRVLLADALVSGAAGALMLFGAALLAPLLNLPVALLVPAGAVLALYAGALVWLARKPALPRGAVWALIAINVLWAIDCLWVSLGGVFAPTQLGHAFIGVQIAAVLLFADLQYMALRRRRSAQPA